MLYINNPDARTTIIEQTRRDHGQHIVTITDADLSRAEDPPSRTEQTLGYLLRPVATS
jgi:hypothetical protein